MLPPEEIFHVEPMAFGYNVFTRKGYASATPVGNRLVITDLRTRETIASLVIPENHTIRPNHVEEDGLFKYPIGTHPDGSPCFSPNRRCGA